MRSAALAAKVFLPMAAWSDLLRQLNKDGEGLLSISGQEQRFSVRLTTKGWKRAARAARRRTSTKAFVAMWFDRSMNATYEEAIRPALVRCGYELPFRVDDHHHDERVGDDGYTNRIDNRILAEIRKARFIVADVTGNRSSVYYEAGFADGLGIPVIWTCRVGNEDDMSFDTRQVGHLLWTNNEDLKSMLIAKIQAYGWELPKRSS